MRQITLEMICRTFINNSNDTQEIIHCNRFLLVLLI
nr:MAG TPA: hypothetical protein [Caudoviricetes sp.]DAO43182.1 MAG TPA: hypothetical protein [Caudoviricetes sp.]